ncbi:MAG: hydroxyacylglutathione hydrolase [Phormidesmis priestleyi Ana]|uniref:Hydroxyacylglutathione hydrolase n=1 Tax=Phormidesmis priestleyi Ana TaxID=1666911 RepID=A0A0P8DJI8_9CYAN|nr:MAG: hydroxyacylglutathione hydrolase [Phormidesmis priestleyi Ana]
MDIYRLPARADNYIFVLHNPVDHTAAVVDPADAPPVLDKLAELGATLVAIFNTHHHNDHVGGNRELIKRFPKAEVYASEEDKGRIPQQTYALKEGDRVTFADRIATVLFVPGHTRGHIAYYFSPTSAPASAPASVITPLDDTPGELFCGDTLFAGGCGRLFEGSPEQMQSSLAKLKALPDNTRIWCAHEYTLSNLKFAMHVEDQNEALRSRFAEVTTARAQNQPTVPALLATEKATNPFLRWESPQLQAIASSQDPVTVFAHIRTMKDSF